MLIKCEYNKKSPDFLYTITKTLAGKRRTGAKAEGGEGESREDSPGVIPSRLKPPRRVSLPSAHDRLGKLPSTPAERLARSPAEKSGVVLWTALLRHLTSAAAGALRARTKGAEKLLPEFSCSFRSDRLSAVAAAPCQRTEVRGQMSETQGAALSKPRCRSISPAVRRHSKL